VDRYELAGPAFQIGVGRRFRFTRRFFGTLEGKTTYGHARVSVARGKASTGNFAVHGLFGIGVAFPVVHRRGRRPEARDAIKVRENHRANRLASREP
jgi:hypothetical protein